MVMMDIAIPNGNEDLFISMAERLGYRELMLLYDSSKFAEMQNIQPNSKIKISFGILAQQRDMQKIKSKFKGHFIAAKSSDSDRDIMEKQYADLIFSLEEASRKDFMHQRGSGLDNILAKLAHDNNVSIGFSISSLLNSKNKNMIMGRMMQNIRLCRKYKTKMVIASFSASPYQMRSPHDIISLFAGLGMSSREAKESLTLERFK